MWTISDVSLNDYFSINNTVYRTSVQHRSIPIHSVGKRSNFDKMKPFHRDAVSGAAQSRGKSKLIPLEDLPFYD